MKKRTLNQLLSLLLTLVIVFGMGTPVFAEGEENGGDQIAPQAADMNVNFVTDEHTTVDLYYTKDDYSQPNETNVITAKVRGKGSTEIDNSGEGQVNFRVNVDEGYTYTVTAAPAENFKNCKGEEETEVADIWRITKITGDLTVTITSTKKEENPDDTPNTPMADSEIKADTVWSYLDDGTDPAAGLSDRTGWTTADYDVSGWKTAAGSFGAKKGAIADLGGGCTPDVLLNQYKADGSTDIEAFFFRTTVNVADPVSVTAITGSVVYDDAATIYINGTKIAGFDDEGITGNLQYGGSNASAPKTGNINVTDPDQIASLLKSGNNIVAVEIHQGRAGSSDIYFAMPALTFETGTPSTKIDQGSVSISVGADETQRNFTWYCSEAGNGTLYLAKNSELENGEMPEGAQAFTASSAAATNKSGYYSNQVTVTGLEQGVTYAYQMENGETRSEIRTFTTGSGDAFSFAFAGDPQIGASGNATNDTDGWEKSLNIVAENAAFDGVDFLLSAGDQVNTANDESQYDGYLNHKALYSLPVATVVGNHDSSSVAYDEHFNVPNESSLGATNASADYYFVYNNVLFMVLNSNNTSTAEHKEFMEQAIAAAGDDVTWKVVTFHHSIYSVASHALEDSIQKRRTELVPVFKDLDVDVVLMGHDHVYCRTYMMDGLTPMTDASIYDDENYSSITNPEGILYVTANSASGSKYYSIQNVEFPYSRVMNQEQIPNVSRIDVSDNQFTITTYRTNDMSVVDTFTINRTTDDENNDTDNNNQNGGTNKPGNTNNNGGNTAGGNQSSPKTQSSSSSPRTGDNSNMVLYMVVMLGALGCSVILVVARRKRKTK